MSEDVKEEFNKAYLDMLFFGTGVIENVDGELKHIPFMETNNQGEINEL